MLKNRTKRCIMKVVLLFVFLLSALSESLAEVGTATVPTLPQVCASCVQGRTCADHPCTGREGLTCEFHSCTGTAVTDAGETIDLPLCQPTFYNSKKQIDTECLALSTSPAPDSSVSSDSAPSSGSSDPITILIGNSTSGFDLNATIGGNSTPGFDPIAISAGNSTSGFDPNATSSGNSTSGFDPNGIPATTDEVPPTNGSGGLIVCPMIYSPVCGSDNITYSNTCVATANNVTKYTPGACEGVATGGGLPLPIPEMIPDGATAAATAAPISTKACPDVMKPVCGSDKKTYANSCSAKSNNITAYTAGACPAPKTLTNATNSSTNTNTTNTNTLGCMAMYAPVCGIDNKTYSNSCIAKQGGVAQYTTGACDQVWALLSTKAGCTASAPVCAPPNTTIYNKCLADVQGIKNYTQGACGSSGNSTTSAAASIHQVSSSWLLGASAMALLISSML